jgi:hypothetical protein
MTQAAGVCALTLVISTSELVESSGRILSRSTSVSDIIFRRVQA